MWAGGGHCNECAHQQREHAGRGMSEGERGLVMNARTSSVDTLGGG